ncbi:MAG: pantoate--beta-alanine ligase [Actinomycetota bacterium]
MKITRSIAEFRAFRESLPEEASVGFVPTMGALHEGHLSLLHAARAGCDDVVLSIFVNPLQFGSNADLALYPRNESADLEAAEREGVDVAFVPSVEEMYPTRRSTTVELGRLSEVAEGESRPGHFTGVATIVAKLLNIVRPTVAFFGQKDAQQVAVVRRMVADLSWPVVIEALPTVREPDGLALSSRNARLSPEERGRATILHRALMAGQAELVSGGDPTSAEKAMLEVAGEEPALDLDYARVLDPDTFEDANAGDSTLLVIAGTIGNTRLIDNVLVDRHKGGDRPGDPDHVRR